MVEDPDDSEGKRRRVDQPESVVLSPAQPETEAATTVGFPADFFSDPSRAPPVAAEDEDDADEAMPPPTVPNPSSLDDEFAAFAKAVLQPSKAASADVYDQATIMAEPELVNHVSDGFPASVTGAD
jgi:zinc finger protein 830